jgi:tetratricopeptide (TPR) repeat protein
MEAWLESLARTESSDELAGLLDAAVLTADAPTLLHGAVLESLYEDRARAHRLNAALQRLAQMRADTISRAWAARCQGHIDHVSGDYEKAVENYQSAATLFESEGLELEVGRSLLSGLQALIFRGQYQQAEQWAARAETIFKRHGDGLRLARLDSNVGNIYFRQDRPKDAAARYRSALEGFEAIGSPRDIAAALSNLAVCSINLGQFTDALTYYKQARDQCQAHGLINLEARADYNIAYLHYLRGDYIEARNIYRVSRERSQTAGDAYHAALCDLDEAEMYLELNLTSEGERMARRGAKGFSRLGMRYEQAKALVNLAVAASQRRDWTFAGRVLIKARRLFVREKNPVWAALVDQLRAVLAFHEMDFDSARRLSASAWRVLTRTAMPGRAAHCQILLARLWMRAGYANRASAIGRAAIRRAGGDVSPSLRFHANLVQGEIYEIQGQWDQAMEAFEAARRDVENLRERVDTEDLRISLLTDKLAVYEGMVALCLESRTNGNGAATARALTLVEQAKSRSLADRLATPDEHAEGSDDYDLHLGDLRRDLNWIYRQIHQAAEPGPGEGGGHTEALRKKAREIEAQIVHLRSTRPQPTGNIAEPTQPEDLPGLQRSLKDGELLLEYYEARSSLYVFLISRDRIEAVKLGPSAPVHLSMKLLRFQLGRFRWAKDLKHASEGSSRAAAYHFRELYRLLLTPIEDRITAHRHLIFAPHRDLHGLPFAALDDGEKLLIDRFTVSAAPSASVLARCRQRQSHSGSGAVVLAVPDPRAPRIEEEARVVVDTLPGAKLLLGEEASLEAFRKYAPTAQILHFAAHGIFRRDNPIFSALQLSDAWLSILDLNRTRLNAGLLTLSGCNTGSSVVVGGDELLGLVRGFLEAGARSLLVTLWDIDDASTQEFMRYFYRKVSAGITLGAAVQGAMREIRERYPHPYFWAPFLLVGDPAATVN